MTIERYIAGQVLGGIVIVFCGLVVLFFVGDLIVDLDDVGRGDFDYPAALAFVVMRMPGRMVALLPAATLIGGLLGLGRLAHGSELTAMRAAGASVSRLVAAALTAGALVAAAGFVVGEWVAPTAERAAHVWRAAALRGATDSGAEPGSRPGFWGRDGQRFVHFGDVLENGWVRDVREFRFGPDGRLLSTWHARRASPPSPAGASAPEAGGNLPDGFWRLEELAISRFHDDGVETERAASMHRRLPADTKALDRFALRPEWLPIPDLVSYAKGLRESGLRAAPVDAALWSRIAAPFSTAAMLFTAIALVLGPLRRAGLGVRITVGIGLGIGFHIVQKVVTQLGVVYDWSAPLAASAPVAALGLLGWWWLRRAAG